MEPNNHPNRPFFKFLWNWLIGTFSLAISLSVVSTIWVSRGGGFSLSTTRKLPQNRLTEYVLLLKTKDSSLLNTNTKDLVEPHPLYQVKMKRKRGTPVSYNVASRPFPSKNMGDPLPGYAATRDDGTWREADSLFSVDFLFTKKTQNASDTPESIIEENLLERLSDSYQKLKEPVGGQKPYPWRQLEDVSYYGSFKKIKAGKKKPSSAFQRTRTNPLLLDFSHNNDLFDVTEESQ